MEEAEYLALLQRVDDPVYAEFPPDYDKRGAVKKFGTLVAVLQARLGCLLEVEHDIQDASHHGAAYLPYDALTEEYVTSVRASNFGNLATLWNEESIVLPSYYSVIRWTLEEHGYIYVPSAVLHLPYTGKNPAITNTPDMKNADGSIRVPSWGDRFFDYL